MSWNSWILMNTYLNKYNLNKYKIPFAQSNYGVFSETASRTGTHDISVDSAWCEGGHWPINKSIQWLWCWFPGHISEKCPFNQHNKCILFSIIKYELNFVKFWILYLWELAGACAMHGLQNLGKGFFVKAFCPGRSYTKFRATTGSSSSYKYKFPL